MPITPTRAEADRRFARLRAFGFSGPIDQDGCGETDRAAVLAIFAGPVEATTRLMAVRAAGGARRD